MVINMVNLSSSALLTLKREDLKKLYDTLDNMTMTQAALSFERLEEALFSHVLQAKGFCMNQG